MDTVELELVEQHQHITRVDGWIIIGRVWIASRLAPAPYINRDETRRHAQRRYHRLEILVVAGQPVETDNGWRTGRRAVALCVKCEAVRSRVENIVPCHGIAAARRASRS